MFTRPRPCVYNAAVVLAVDNELCLVGGAAGWTWGAPCVPLWQILDRWPREELHDSYTGVLWAAPGRAHIGGTIHCKGKLKSIGSKKKKKPTQLRIENGGKWTPFLTLFEQYFFYSQHFIQEYSVNKGVDKNLMNRSWWKHSLNTIVGCKLCTGLHLYCSSSSVHILIRMNKCAHIYVGVEGWFRASGHWDSYSANIHWIWHYHIYSKWILNLGQQSLTTDLRLTPTVQGHRHHRHNTTTAIAHGVEKTAACWIITKNSD